MCMLDKVREKREEIYELARKNHAEKLWLFGSCARKEERPDSDVDFLVQFDGHASLFDACDIKDGLERQLNRKADVVSYKCILDDSMFSHMVKRDMVAI